MKILKMIGAGVLTLMMIVPAQAQKEDHYEKSGDKVKVTRYYEDGSVKEVGTYSNGTPDGKWVEYTQDGKVKVEAFYSNGQKEGKWFVWTDDGEFLYEVIYKDNMLKNASKWKISERNAIANN